MSLTFVYQSGFSKTGMNIYRHVWGCLFMLPHHTSKHNTCWTTWSQENGVLKLYHFSLLGIFFWFSGKSHHDCWALICMEELQYISAKTSVHKFSFRTFCLLYFYCYCRCSHIHQLYDCPNIPVIFSRSQDLIYNATGSHLLRAISSDGHWMVIMRTFKRISTTIFSPHIKASWAPHEELVYTLFMTPTSGIKTSLKQHSLTLHHSKLKTKVRDGVRIHLPCFFIAETFFFFSSFACIHVKTQFWDCTAVLWAE